MSMNIQVQIPVTPLVKKYMAVRFDYQPSVRLSLSKTSPITLFISNILKPAPKYANSIGAYNNAKKYRHFINVDLCGYSDRRKYHLDSNAIAIFNKFITGLLYNEFKLYMDCRRSSVDASIRDFLSIYELEEEDLSFLSLKRHYYRHVYNVGNEPKELRA